MSDQDYYFANSGGAIAEQERREREDEEARDTGCLCCGAKVTMTAFDSGVCIDCHADQFEQAKGPA